MPSTDPQLRSVSCPGCGAHYDFPASMAGRQGRCVSCGTVFAVPAFGPSVNIDTSAVAALFEEEEQESKPQYISVECRVCQTRMYGRPDQVGQTIKCPDCGARTEVPPPPKPKAKNIPAALEGDQYELWDADEQPLPSALVAAQPKYIAIKCRQCDTLMHATEKQVGQTIACPDCGKKHKVPAPRAPKPVERVLTRNAETPVLDPAFPPVERPPALPAATLQKIEDELDATPYAKALAESRRTGKPLKVDRRGRPILPRWPLVTGILPFYFSSGVSERWLALTMGYIFGGYLISEGLIWGSAGGLAAMSALMFFVTGMLISLLLTAAGAGMFRAIVTESSEGNDRVQDWGTRYINE